MRDYVLYHAHCPDGFGAAWAAWKRLGHAATYVAVRHGVPPPDMPDCERLFLVDFAYPAQQLAQLRERVPHITILDHHKSAQAALTGIGEAPPRFDPDQARPGLFVTLDMEESGATLAWRYFHPDTDCPELLLYIKDRDLWRHALPASQAVNAAIRSYPYDFTVWAERLADEQAVTHLIPDGEAIVRKQAQDVDELSTAVMWMELEGHRIPVLNATSSISEVGHRLCELFPNAPFSVSYRDTGEDRREWSLRSVGDFDVSEIAKQYGGGGHRNAAGFRTARPPLLIDD